VGDAVAIISVVASSTVALAAVAAQLWQGHLDRESERRTWLRDRRADTYISMFRLFEKTPDQVTQDEWEHLMAAVHAFASPTMTDLFAKWGDASTVTWDRNASEDALQTAYQDADSAQRDMRAQAISELQGSQPGLRI
jgi:hypothetical protein